MLNVDPEVILKNKFNNFVDLGLIWIKIKCSEGGSYSDEFYHNGNSINFKNIPKGTYLVDIKAGYEPSNDSYAKYKEVILIE
jgi:hypothetical protein